jgi:hypothetical protein
VPPLRSHPKLVLAGLVALALGGVYAYRSAAGPGAGGGGGGGGAAASVAKAPRRLRRFNRSRPAALAAARRASCGASLGRAAELQAAVRINRPQPTAVVASLVDSLFSRQVRRARTRAGGRARPLLRSRRRPALAGSPSRARRPPLSPSAPTPIPRRRTPQASSRRCTSAAPSTRSWSCCSGWCSSWATRASACSATASTRWAGAASASGAPRPAPAARGAP